MDEPARPSPRPPGGQAAARVGISGAVLAATRALLAGRDRGGARCHDRPGRDHVPHRLVGAARPPHPGEQDLHAPADPLHQPGGAARPPRPAAPDRHCGHCGCGHAYRAPRLLCIDELGAVVGQPAWERELFALYRDCEERAATLVMAARETPAQLPFALPDLASRCAAGQRLGLLALDEPEQCEALRLRARQRGFELPEEAARYLQRRLPRDMASLFALLDELDTAALAAQRRLTVPFIRDALARRRGEGG